MKFSLPLVVLIILGCLNCNHSSESSIGKVTTPFNKNVPFITIKSEGEISDEPKRNAQFSLRLKDSTLLKSNIGIEIRGAFSQEMYEKKSYGFEFRNDKNETISHEILGLPKNSTWILHGPFGDKTLLRNSVAYKISNNIGKYAARTAFVELEINGEYLGFYVLMEKLMHDKDRIKIEKLTKKDSTDEKITGGYILKIDKNAGNGGNQYEYNDKNSFPSKFDVNGKLSKRTKTNFMYEYPKAKNITSKQKNYIQKYLSDFENSLVSTDFKDEIKGYKNFIEIESFIDYFILVELMQNHDGYRLSTYLQKDRNKKLEMGPNWDFDIAFGSDNGFCGGMNDHAWVFQYNKYCGDDPWLVPFWWKRLIEDEDFKNKLKARWISLRDSQLSDNQLDKTIDDYQKYITENGMVARNFEKWLILNKRIMPNSSKGSHEKEISRMKTWLRAHAQWIDENIVKL